MKDEIKYKIQQVSGNCSREMPDHGASIFLDALGFRSPREDVSEFTYLYLGAIPKEGKEFFVYYKEPEKGTHGGSFRLIKRSGLEEEEIDGGNASESHFHGGLKTLTFYGRGSKLRSCSIHCKPEEIK